VKFYLENEKQTRQLAGIVAGLLQPRDCIALYGTLGVGKTAFMRHLIAAMGGPGQEVVSPTFLLMQEYPVSVQGQEVTLWHIDAYRLKEPSEWAELGADELFAQGIVCIEWPEICARALPKDHLAISMDHAGEHCRSVTLTGHGRWKSILQNSAERFDLFSNASPSPESHDA
jgi:tRNA threonylcarbamoyladenosine biosynthesis protein TsaE